MALDSTIVGALIGAAAVIAVPVVTSLLTRRREKDAAQPIAPHHVTSPQEMTVQPHVRDRSHALLDLRDLRETLDELVAEHGGFIVTTYEDRRNELRMSFRWRDWDLSQLTARKASTGRHPPIFFEFFAPSNWPGSGPLELKLLLGKTPDGFPPRLLEIAEANPLFDVHEKPWPDGSRSVFHRDLLPISVRPTDRDARLRREWSAFVEKDLPRLISAFEQPLSS